MKKGAAITEAMDGEVRWIHVGVVGLLAVEGEGEKRAKATVWGGLCLVFCVT